MPVKLRTPKARAHRITPAAIDAYVAGDYLGLHRALGLRPWEPSPLPLAVTPLGVDPDRPGDAGKWPVRADWDLAASLQLELRAQVKRK